MILSQEELANAMGFHPDQTARIAKCLTQQGIVFFYGKNGRIWTTTELIALAVTKTPVNSYHNITIDA